jgi:hypothetical protein
VDLHHLLSAGFAGAPKFKTFGHFRRPRQFKGLRLP